MAPAFELYFVKVFRDCRRKSRKIRKIRKR
jgi:hypothetical protein